MTTKSDVERNILEPLYAKAVGVAVVCIPAFLALTYLLYPLLHNYHDLAVVMEDDAFYYVITARNIALHGRSTFDGISLTNGYQPIWLLMLTFLQVIRQGSLLAIYELQLLLNVASLIALYYLMPGRNVFATLLVFGCYVFSMRLSGLRGMEIDLLIFSMIVLMLAAYTHGAYFRTRGVLVGLICCSCIGARIDAAVFVLPLLLASQLPWRTKLRAVAVIAVAGLVYAAANRAMFGAAAPVSGMIKSLGGFHLNRPFIAQFTQKLIHGSLLARLRAATEDRLHWLGWIGIIFVALVLATGGQARRLAAAFLLGYILFAAKIMLFSSWVVWNWYNYPVLIGFIILVMIVFSETDGVRGRTSQAGAMFVPGMAILVLATGLAVIEQERFITTGANGAHERGWGFSRINKMAGDYLNQHAGGQLVAMGDRAGSLGYYYAGGVVQLEGLVGDVDYLRFLVSGTDPTAFLCQRGVKYILSYETDLGKYDQYAVPVIRPFATDYTKIPHIVVSAREQVAEFQDLSLFDNRNSGGLGDNFLYLWKFPKCP